MFTTLTITAAVEIVLYLRLRTQRTTRATLRTRAMQRIAVAR